MESITQVQQQKETIRIETFSDGVFCIAVTLLSLEVGVEVKKDISNGQLVHELLAKWPVYLAYVISFINVLLAWIGHHSLFKKLYNTDNAVMISNGLLLMIVALVPFPTKTLGEFFLTGAFKTAVVFYTAYFVLISVAFRLLWYAASRNKNLLSASVTENEIRLFMRSENIGLICNSVIFAIAFVNPWIALALSFIMWIYWMLLA